MNANEYKATFDQINNDAGEFIPLSEVDFYAEQILNMNEENNPDMTYDEALAIAKDVAAL